MSLDFLETTQEFPFLILSDINVPELDDFALHQKVHVNAQLQLTCIPYLFFFTGVSQQMVIDAYSLSVQGFFIEQTTTEELEGRSSLLWTIGSDILPKQLLMVLLLNLAVFLQTMRHITGFRL